jgi:hypothetical protein
MRDVHLPNLDLNLLHRLHALLEECHVTRAAKRGFLNQSAMSRALERLRDMWKRVRDREVRAPELLRSREETEAW